MSTGWKFEQPVLALAGLILASETLAVELELDLALSKIASDNIALAPEGLEERDDITALEPSLVVTHDGPSLDVDIDYGAQILSYSRNSALDDVYHQLASSVLLEAVPRWFYVETLADYGQINADLSGRMSLSNIFFTGNRADLLTLDLRPYVSHSFAGGTNLLVSTDFGRDQYDDPSIGDVDVRLFEFTLASEEDGRTFLWAFEHQYVELNYELSPEAKAQRAGFRLGTMVASMLQLFTAFGKESDYFSRSEADLVDDYWEVGIDWSTARNQLVIAAGRRSFDDTARLLLGRQFGQNTLQLSYSKQPQTTELLTRDRRVRGDEAIRVLPDGSLGTAERFIYERSAFDMSVAFTNSFLDFSVYDENRLQRLDEMDMPLPAEKVQGFDFEWIWEFGARTQLAIGAGLYRRDIVEFDSPVDVEYRTIGVDHQLGLRTELSFWIGREMQIAGVDDPDNEYVGNYAGISISRTIFQ